MEILTPALLIAAIAAFVAGLRRMNAERTAETPWGDAALRAFTRATAVFALAFVASCILVFVFFVLADTVTRK